MCVGGGECRVGDLRIRELTYIKNSLVKLKRANKQDFKEIFSLKTITLICCTNSERFS